MPTYPQLLFCIHLHSLYIVYSVHLLEFLPTPCLHAPQGYSPNSSTGNCSELTCHLITLVFPILIWRHSASIPICHFSINIHNFSSATSIRSSKYRSFQGKFYLKLLDYASIAMMNSNTLNTSAWCTPSLTSNTILTPFFYLTAVLTPAYIDLTTSTIHSNYTYLKLTPTTVLHKIPYQKLFPNLQMPTKVTFFVTSTSPAFALQKKKHL